jgi:hypothetical protein
MNKVPQPLEDLGQDEQSHQICAQLWPDARRTMANDKELRLCVIRDCSKVTEFVLSSRQGRCPYVLRQAVARGAGQ